jgi:hypothetical protein
MKPFKGQISNWKIRTGYEGTRHVVGIPHGHPEFEDWIITSPVINTTEKPRHRDEDCIFMLTTKNSQYDLLGEEQEQEVPCPNKNYFKYGISL